MIYVVTVDGKYEGIASSVKKALALAYCEVGRVKEVTNEKTFLKDVRAIKKDLKVNGNYTIFAPEGPQGDVGSQFAEVSMVNVKSVENALEDKYGVIYDRD